jgi:hypothetical protein
MVDAATLLPSKGHLTPMPSGHTDKVTLTDHRRGLLERLPLEARGLRAADRRQLNDCSRFGWVVESGGWYRLTEEGRRLLGGSPGLACPDMACRVPLPSMEEGRGGVCEACANPFVVVDGAPVSVDIHGRTDGGRWYTLHRDVQTEIVLRLTDVRRAERSERRSGRR